MQIMTKDGWTTLPCVSDKSPDYIADERTAMRRLAASEVRLMPKSRVPTNLDKYPLLAKAAENLNAIADAHNKAVIERAQSMVGTCRHW